MSSVKVFLRVWYAALSTVYGADFNAAITAFPPGSTSSPPASEGKVASTDDELELLRAAL